MRSYAHLSGGQKENQIGGFAGRGAARWRGHCPGARSGRKLPSPGSLQRNALPLGWVLAASRRRSLSIAQGGVKRSSNGEAALRLFVGDRLAEGWTPGATDLRLVEIRERTSPAAAGNLAVRQSTASSIGPRQKAAAFWRYLTRRHKRRRPRRARASRDAIKGSSVGIHDRPKTIEGRGEAGHWEGDLIICKRTRPVLVFA